MSTVATAGQPLGPLVTGAAVLFLSIPAVLAVAGAVESRAALAAAVLLGDQGLTGLSSQPLITVATVFALAVVLLVRGLRRGHPDLEAVRR